MNNCPDRWVVLTITSEEFGSIDKLFFGGYGGYVGSDSWGMNSGIESVEKIDQGYRFHGVSGSAYDCHENSYGMSGYMTGVYNQMVENLKGLAAIEINKEYENISRS